MIISLVSISQSYFKVLKTIKPNGAHFIIKNWLKRELQQIASNHSSEIVFKDFIKLILRIIKDYNKEPYSFLVNDATLWSDNPLWFRKKNLW